MKDKNKVEVKEGGERTPRPGGYSFAILGAKRDKKRAAAEKRQVEYDSFTVDQKIARAKKHRGESKQEIARLLKSKESKLKVALLQPSTPEVVETVVVIEPPKPKKKAYQKPKKS